MQSFLEQLNSLMTFSGGSKLSSTEYRPPNERINLEVGNRSQTGFVGVTLHKRTQRYEAHIWSDKKQIYLGSYCDKAQAARAHDLMALKVKGQDTLDLNFSLNDYQTILTTMDTMAQADIIGALRSHSKYLNSFARSGHGPIVPDKGKPEEHPQRPMLTGPTAPPEGQSARISKRKQARPSSSLGSYLAVEEPAQVQQAQKSVEGTKAQNPVPRYPTNNSSTQPSAGPRTNTAHHIARKPKLITTKSNSDRNAQSPQSQSQQHAPFKGALKEEEGGAVHPTGNQSGDVKATKSSTLGTPRMERECIRTEKREEH